MVKCFDIASMVINQASKEINDKYYQSDELNDNLKKICETIDAFLMPGQVSGCNESYGFDVDVDLETQEIIIGMEFDLCELHKEASIYEAIKKANYIKIMTSDTIMAVRVEMHFPGVWVE